MLIGDSLVEQLFVFTEVPPVLLFEPGRISGHPDTGITSRRRACEFLIPTVDHRLEIKSAIAEIPVASRYNLNAVVNRVSIELRNNSFQRMPGVFHRKRLGNHPQ